jgi:hypothetical protein
MTKQLRVVDLFAGLKGWSIPFDENGHETWSTDLDEKFDVDHHGDILDLGPSDIPWRPDVVLASPPCEKFSVMTIGRYWRGGNEGYIPTPPARTNMAFVYKTVTLVEALQPRFSVIENPRGVLRKLGILEPRYSRVTVTYCQYGLPYMKPTDLWVSKELLEYWTPRPMCKNGDPCHARAPRGARTGIQSSSELLKAIHPNAKSADLPALRSVIPYQLASEIRDAIESAYVEEAVA